MNIYVVLCLFVLANVAALVGIAAWYRRDRAALVAERDECRRGWSGALDLCDENNRLINMWRDLHRQAREDADWNKTLHTVALAELDRLSERHAVLLSLDGIRADRADGIAYPGDEPPLSVAVSTASVTPIRKGRAR